MRPATLMFTILGAFTNGITSAAEQNISCPERLEPEAIQSNHPPAGWELHMLRPVYLTEGGMLHGPPEESAFLVPDDSSSRRIGKQTLETLRWSFDVPNGQTLWVYCGYGGGGATLKLFKMVTKGVRECTLSTLSTTGPIKDSVKLSCK